MKTIDMSGKSVPADSINRSVWWGSCGYWTDDWDKLLSSDSIPVCPECGCPGYYGTADEFLGKGLDAYDHENPGYKDFLFKSKEMCMKSSGGIFEAFERSKEL